MSKYRHITCDRGASSSIRVNDTFHPADGGRRQPKKVWRTQPKKTPDRSKKNLPAYLGRRSRPRALYPTPYFAARRGALELAAKGEAGGGGGEGGGEAVRPSVGAAGMVGESVGAWATGCGWLGGDGILLWPRCSALEPCGGSAHLLMWLGCARLSGTKC